MQNPDRDRPQRQFHVVGIGASAGGLDALLEFFGAVPANTGMAFVVIQHMEPRSESHLAEILERATTMPVVQAQEGELVRTDHVYVIPPNTRMIISGGALHLAPRPHDSRAHYPIDAFFEALGNECGAAAVGLILSGTASDGAQGVRSIKAAGGTTFAQDEQSAKYSGMPRNAILTGAVDFVLAPARIAGELIRIDAHPYVTAPIEQLEGPVGEGENDGEFPQILERLRAATRVDFSQYKLSTIRRRLGRRLVVNHLSDLREYLEYLDGHPGEIHDLYRDILISVTSFFREPEMFAVLENVLRDYFGKHSKEESLRMWVPGCATGEEAYSLAIVALEVMERIREQRPIQLFGTDLSDSAIDRARTGIYSAKTTAGISPERLQRYFSRVDSGFRIKQQVRDCCVFAKHDLTSDPPFSQMDVVSCRNVFIYLSASLQQRVLPSLHYSLKPEGLLVLGSAETVGNRTDLFGIADQEHRIYVKRPGTSHISFDMTPRPRIREASPEAPTLQELRISSPAPVDVEARAARTMRDLYAPPGVVINEEMQILRVHGQVGFYLDVDAGETRPHLLRVAREDLVNPIRRAVSAALSQKQPVHESGIQVHHDGQVREVDVSVIPLTDDDDCLVLFEQNVPGRPPAAVRDRGIDASAADLELTYAQRELAQTKDYLRKVIEQHEAVIEELRSANEEAQSSNEELQSTNEELRTAKEELQSTNEELTTVNDELQHRNRDLSLATNDLSNILSAAMIPIVMAGMDLRIRRFTPAAERLLGLSPAALGRLLTEINSSIHIPNLAEMLSETLHSLVVQQKRVQDRDGRWLNLCIRPYRTLDERIDGVVLTFIDVDEATRALARAEEARRFAEGMVETVQHPLLVLDGELRVLRANDAFYSTFSARKDETIGREIDQLGNGQWKIPELRRLLQQALLRDVPFRDFEVTHDFPHIGRKFMRLNARRIAVDESDFTVLLAIEDVTGRQESAEIQYRRLFESAKDGIIVVSSSGRVLDVNPYFLEMSRYPLSDLMGRPFQDIPPFLEDEQVRSLVSETQQNGTTRYDSVHLRGKDGREALVEIIANRYPVKDQTFIQLNIRDVTERRRGEERLRQANIDLQQFAFAASHDLQEPLRTITIYLELLKRDGEGLGADAEQYMKFIASANDRMRQLVLDLLGYSHVVRADLKIRPVSAAAALSVAMMNLQLAIQTSEARITYDSLPVISIDETHLVQLLQNLISNAIKYRGQDPPAIHISAREAGPEWIFSVKDNGVGIDMKYSEQIFAVFKRLHANTSPGTGVGLAICKKIVERVGGRIWVESESGHGSTFYFSVPK